MARVCDLWISGEAAMVLFLGELEALIDCENI